MFLSRIGLFYPPHLTYCSYNLLIISKELKLHSSWNLYDIPITCISLTYFLILLKQYLQRNHRSTAVLGKRLCSISFLLIPWNGIPWSLLVFLLWINYGWLSTCSKLITPRRFSKSCIGIRRLDLSTPWSHGTALCSAHLYLPSSSRQATGFPLERTACMERFFQVPSAFLCFVNFWQSAQ